MRDQPHPGRCTAAQHKGDEMTLYEELTAAGVETDHHESDLPMVEVSQLELF